MTPAPAGKPIPLDTLLLLIGRLNYAWTNTESLLIHLIAGLCSVDKETAVIIFLTLNTSRARVDLVDRLAKTARTGTDERQRVLSLTKRMLTLASLRNRYNHCIYSFDPESGNMRTILMRIADRKDNIKVGETTDIDEGAIRDIERALADLTQLNVDMWSAIHDYGYPV